MSQEVISSLLLVEDDPGVARLLREMFKQPGSLGTALTHVECMADAEGLLAKQRFDVILLDPGLPDSQGIDSVRRAHAAAPHVPLVVLTGLEDETLALQALQEGAQDYLVKGRIDTRGLLRFLRYAVERNSMEQALFVAEDRAQVTLDSIGDAVVCADNGGTITFLNGAAQRLTGWSWQEAAGRPVAEVVRILDATSRRSISGPSNGAPAPDSIPTLPDNSILVRQDGQETPIEHTIAIIHDREQQAAGTVTVFRDVSAARSSQQQLLAVGEELERSNRELQDFAAIASHDLQEPLRKIQAFGERLSEHSSGALDEEAEDYLRRMRNAAGRMQTLINDLLQYSQVTIQPDPARAVDLGQVVADVLVDLDERIRSSGGTVHVGVLPTVLASPFQMRQLFQNLIANALKFHPDGVAPDVHVDATTPKDSRAMRRRPGHAAALEIRVSDNGIGFDEKHAERIFAPFQRLHGRAAYEGTGMGLAICRRIVAVSGGTLTATSEPGAGATFLISLPQAAVVVEPLAPVA